MTVLGANPKRLRTNTPARATWSRATPRQKTAIVQAAGFDWDYASTLGRYTWKMLPKFVRSAISRQWARPSRTYANPRSGVEIKKAWIVPIHPGSVASEGKWDWHVWIEGTDGSVLASDKVSGGLTIAEAVARRLLLEVKAWRKIRPNPLTRGEAADTLRSARRDLQESAGVIPGKERSFYAGRAVGKAWGAKIHGPFREEYPGSESVFRRGYRLGLRNNPMSRAARDRISSRISKLVREGYPQRQAIAIAYSEAHRAGYRVPAAPNPKGKGKHPTQRTLANPGRRRRRVTMSLREFAERIRRTGNRALMADFERKIRDYRRWTHGSLPTRVTVEAVDTPGASGVLLMTDLGRAPETTYVMPGNSKRKGAWKHPWTRMPALKGDPRAGLIVTKLAGGNRLSDFLHG